MESFPWVNNYPQGIPAEIKLYEYDSVAELFESSCEKYRDRVAFENMVVKMTFGETDKLSKDFAAYFRKHKSCAYSGSCAFRHFAAATKPAVFQSAESSCGGIARRLIHFAV